MRRCNKSSCWGCWDVCVCVCVCIVWFGFSSFISFVSCCCIDADNCSRFCLKILFTSVPCISASRPELANRFGRGEDVGIVDEGGIGLDEGGVGIVDEGGIGLDEGGVGIVDEGGVGIVDEGGVGLDEGGVGLFDTLPYIWNTLSINTPEARISAHKALIMLFWGLLVTDCWLDWLDWLDWTGRGVEEEKEEGGLWDGCVDIGVEAERELLGNDWGGKGLGGLLEGMLEEGDIEDPGGFDNGNGGGTERLCIVTDGGLLEGIEDVVGLCEGILWRIDNRSIE